VTGGFGRRAEIVSQCVRLEPAVGFVSGHCPFTIAAAAIAPAAATSAPPPAAVLVVLLDRDGLALMLGTADASRLHLYL
jgi:hypothetical protein